MRANPRKVHTYSGFLGRRVWEAEALNAIGCILAQAVSTLYCNTVTQRGVNTQVPMLCEIAFAYRMFMCALLHGACAFVHARVVDIRRGHRPVRRHVS
jgi:hypothetical protein